MSYTETQIQKVETRMPTRLLEFFAPGAFSDALEESGYTVQEEIDTLLEIMRESPNYWSKLAAMRHLNAREKEVLEMSGHLQKMTAQATVTDEDDNQVLLTSQAQKLCADSTMPELPGEDRGQRTSGVELIRVRNLDSDSGCKEDQDGPYADQDGPQENQEDPQEEVSPEATVCSPGDSDVGREGCRKVPGSVGNALEQSPTEAPEADGGNCPGDDAGADPDGRGREDSDPEGNGQHAEGHLQDEEASSAHSGADDLSSDDLWGRVGHFPPETSKGGLSGGRTRRKGQGTI